ncbi:MAG: formylglycine-generating enzyme family protein [Lachnospiraceae bacterium]|nr:formylglycine-generating enzyme family protein [Lachnospiraceae bacterium]
MKRIGLILICIVTVLCMACSKKANVDYGDNIVISLEGCEIVLNKISAGNFLMGSYEGIGDEDELPVREVTITEDFYMGVFEITQAQWEAVMGNNPSTFKGKELPVETISWKDANAFCEKLSELSGYDVSLPTEAQWEYACRAGTTTKWFFGDEETAYSTYGETDVDAKTYPVGSFEANPNGLYDMYGNVMEWCLDYYSAEYLADDLTDPTGPKKGEARISRGGGWGASPDSCRSGYRNACGEQDATDGIGFRIVINP